MPNHKAALFLVSIIACCSLLLSTGCKDSSESERFSQYLASISAQEESMPGKSPLTLPSLKPAGGPGSVNADSHSIIGGTPRQVKDGFCGDGIINGPNEDCDQGAIQNTACIDYGALTGNVRCQENCLYDISDCITPAVDRVIGGTAETCKCNCDNSLCRGSCASLGGAPGQSTCRFDCDNDCICRCEGKMEAHVESCDLRCECLVDAAGVPQCACNLDECDLITTISPNIATIATSRVGAGHR